MRSRQAYLCTLGIMSMQNMHHNVRVDRKEADIFSNKVTQCLTYRQLTLLQGRGIKRCFSLTSVCLMFVCLTTVCRVTQEQRGLGRLKLAQRQPMSHVTRTPLSRSKVKGQLVADVLNSQYTGTGATWRRNAKILSCCRGGGISWRPPASSLFIST